MAQWPCVIGETEMGKLKKKISFSLLLLFSLIMVCVPGGNAIGSYYVQEKRAKRVSQNQTCLIL